MGKSYIDVYSSKTAKWFAQGKSLENIKELLRLPDSFQVDKTEFRPENDGLRIFVSSLDIPEISEFNGLHAHIRCDYDHDINDGFAGFVIEPYPLRIACASQNIASEA